MRFVAQEILQHPGFPSGPGQRCNIWLVVWATPLKNMNVNWDDEIPNIWENKVHGNQTTNQSLLSGTLYPVLVASQICLTIPRDFEGLRGVKNAKMLAKMQVHAGKPTS